MQTLNQNTKYILIFNINNSTSSSTNNYIMVRGYNTDGTFKEYGRTIKKFGNGRHYILLESTQGNVEHILIGSDFSCEIDDTILVIYQDGMENWDIPYFEGMQSVKIPVLTTTGKNLWRTDLFNSAHINDYYVSTKYTLKQLCPNLIVGESYIASMNYQYTGSISEMVGVATLSPFANLNNSFIYTEELGESLVYLYGGNATGTMTNFQVEQGSVATPYEPYKTNILTVNEDIELRGIGDVQDTLDCLTGEVTERIGEVVLDGSDDEGWVRTYVSGEVTRFNSASNTLPFAIGRWTNKITVKCDKLVATHNNGWNGKIDYIYQGGNKNVFITKKEGTTLDEFKECLSQNPITVQYQLETESVKTVDLTTVNENGESDYFLPLEGTMNVHSSGEIIQPTFDMSVPVEATTQNLASFIDLETEEKQ